MQKTSREMSALGQLGDSMQSQKKQSRKQIAYVDDIAEAVWAIHYTPYLCMHL